jgi:hypothetical protein
MIKLDLGGDSLLLIPVWHCTRPTRYILVIMGFGMAVCILRIGRCIRLNAVKRLGLLY